MPHIEDDPESGQFSQSELSGVCLGGLAEPLSAATGGKADEPLVPVSGSLEEVCAQLVALALAREGDTHALWRHLNKTWKP
jgi:hypothetical protein